MDPLSHALLGAAASRGAFSKYLPRSAGLLGALAALTPDLDVLIHSESDPTLSWIYHRHFTHSLAFIPLGAFLCSLVLFVFPFYRKNWRTVYLATLVGFSTHCLLDTATSYGTLLLWPFSTNRIALDWQSIIDPVYTSILLVGVSWSAVARTAKGAQVALLLSLSYLLFGAYQHQAAAHTAKQLASTRGHEIKHHRLLPAPGSNVLWRSVYLSKGEIFADGIRVPWFGPPQVLEGRSTSLVDFASLPAQIQQSPAAVKAFSVLAWFADGFVAAHQAESPVIGDLRYADSLNGTTPLWGLQFDLENPSEPRKWRSGQRVRSLEKLLAMIFDPPKEFRRLSGEN